jgi:tetratricopeptide (TPR) repeat protein/transcriptional regulator with XRE-family HTH domain
MDYEPGQREQVNGLGGLLRGYRIAAGLSQEELAQRCNLSARAVSDIERGRTSRPYVRSVRLLADALGLDPQARERLFEAAYGQPDARQPQPPADEEDASGGTALPMQLPPPVHDFVGRCAELHRLTELGHQSWSGTTPRIVVISGMAGVGKTALALHWAHQAAASFPDGQLYLDLRGFTPGPQPTRPAEPIQDLLEGLGVSQHAMPAGTAARIALYRSLLSGRRALVVLDDALSAAQVRPLIPGSPGSFLLITSRGQLTGLAAVEHAHIIQLGLLPYPDARQLLERRLGGDHAECGQQAIQAIIQRCGRLPLALGIAAARAAAIPGPRAAALGAVATELGEMPAGLDALDCGEPAADLRAVFSASYRKLPPVTARLFRLMGSQPGPAISVPAAASMADLPPREVRRSIGELTQANLLAEHPAGRYRLHDLLRAYAAEQGQADGHGEETDAAMIRLLDHYLHTAHGAAIAITKTRDPLALDPPAPGVTPEALSTPRAALAWFGAEHAALLAAARLAASRGFDAYAWQIPWSMGAYLDFSGRWETWIAVQRLARAAASRQADVAAQAQALAGLGSAYLRLGRHDRARAQLDRAACLYQQAGDNAGLAMNHLLLAYVHDREHEYQAALSHAQHALGLFDGQGHRAGRAKALNAAAWYQARLGEHATALEFGERALEEFRVLDDQPNEAATLDTLGYIRQQLGQPAEAIACFERAAGLFHQVGDRQDEASVLIHLATCQQDAGYLGAAAAVLRCALRILDELRAPEAAAVRERLGLLPDAHATDHDPE